MILYRKISVKDRLPIEEGNYVFFYRDAQGGPEIIDYGPWYDDSSKSKAFVGEFSSEHGWVKYPYGKDRDHYVATAWLEETSFP